MDNDAQHCSNLKKSQENANIFAILHKSVDSWIHNLTQYLSSAQSATTPDVPNYNNLREQSSLQFGEYGILNIIRLC